MLISLWLICIDLEVNFYHIRATDGDFDNVDFKASQFQKPKYIPSPFETWLSISDPPEASSIADWFRSASSRNLVVESTLKLLYSGDVNGINGKPIYKYWNSKYWVVDGSGFRSQGQVDSETNRLQNQGLVIQLY